jgi:hypothetical protein
VGQEYGIRCGGLPCRGYYDILANGAMIYPSQGGRYQGCMALG